MIQLFKMVKVFDKDDVENLILFVGESRTKA